MIDPGLDTRLKIVEPGTDSPIQDPLGDLMLTFLFDDKESSVNTGWFARAPHTDPHPYFHDLGYSV